MVYFYLLIASIIIFFIGIKISNNLKLLDYPEKRKIHIVPTPYTGGFIISIIFLIIVNISDFNQSYFNNILTYGILISLFGLLDDKYKLGVGSKLILQLLPMLILIFLNDIKINELRNIPIFGNIELGSFNYIFTILCVYLLINSSNYLDGFDGVLSISIITSFVFLLISIDNINLEISNFIIFLLIPIIVFTFFNLNMFGLSKIFLGDSGSNLLGYILAFTVIIAYLEYNIDIGTIIWLLSFQVYEFLSVNILRIQRRKNLFLPAKDHIHHIIFKKTKSKLFTNFYLLFIQIFLISFGFFTQINYGQKISIYFFLTFFLIFFFLRKKLLMIYNKI